MNIEWLECEECWREFPEPLAVFGSSAEHAFCSEKCQVDWESGRGDYEADLEMDRRQEEKAFEKNP